MVRKIGKEEIWLVGISKGKTNPKIVLIISISGLFFLLFKMEYSKRLISLQLALKGLSKAAYRLFMSRSKDTIENTKQLGPLVEVGDWIILVHPKNPWKYFFS